MTEEASPIESQKKIGNTVSKEPEEPRKPYKIEKSTNQTKPTDHTRETKKESDTTIPPREEIEKFLEERCVSQSLIRTLLKVGFSDEFIRLLMAMGLTEKDVTMLQNLWSLEAKEPEETDSSVSLPSSSDEYLSSDGLYLKNFLSKPLANALREILAKKPFDPVEYLGHWLLNYKICEERGRRHREFELELMIERERLRSQDVEDEVLPPMRCEEEEEYVDDWNYLNYE